jgi:hypothetical protein
MQDQLTCAGATVASARPGSPWPDDDGPVLRFGFSYQHLRALAKRVVRNHVPSMGMDAEDRFAEAHGAIAEYLYAAQEPPSPLDLIKAGERGLDRLRRASLRERGYGFTADPHHRDPGTGAWAARSHWRFWYLPASATPEERATDRAAVAQVMAALEPEHALVLRALAEHADRASAAAALGVPDKTFGVRLSAARRAALVLWHDREAPSRLWRREKRPHRLRRAPAGGAEEARALADIARAFGGRTRVAALDLLAALAAADPGRYGTWRPGDLRGFLRLHGAVSHTIDVGGDHRDKHAGYWLEEVTRALNDLAAPGIPAGQAA